MSEYEVSPTWHELKNLIMAAPKYLKVEDKFDIEWMCTRKNIFREALNYLYNIGSFDKEA